MIDIPPVVPELAVTNLQTSLAVYQRVFGFRILAERPEEQFAYVALGEAHLMLEQADGQGRRFVAAPLEAPFGRGLNIQIRVVDVDALYSRVVAAGFSRPCRLRFDGTARGTLKAAIAVRGGGSRRLPPAVLYRPPDPPGVLKARPAPARAGSPTCGAHAQIAHRFANEAGVSPASQMEIPAAHKAAPTASGPRPKPLLKSCGRRRCGVGAARARRREGLFSDEA